MWYLSLGGTGVVCVVSYPRWKADIATVDHRLHPRRLVRDQNISKVKS